MKKYFILMSAALVALSCAKELADPQEASKNDNGEYKTITFSSIATKTTLDEGTGVVAWEEGDEISIHYIDATGNPAEVVAKAASAGATTTFTAQIPVEDDPTEYYAAYPSGAGRLTVATGEESEATTVSFAVNVALSKCDGTFKAANFSAAYTAAGENMTLAFKNAVGIVKVPLPEGGIISHNGADYNISGVNVRGTGGTVDGAKINGNVPVEITDNAISGFGAAEDGNANLNLAKLSDEAIAAGYAFLPAAEATLLNGICVRYLSGDGTIPAVLSQEKNITITRGHVCRLPDEVSDMMVFDYYVSTDGEGDGTTADAPMNITKMQEMFTAAGATMAACYKLDGVTFNLADGTYNLSSTLSIPQSANKTIYQCSIKGNPGKAILDAQEACGIMNIGNYKHLILSGLVFINGKTTGNGGAISIPNASKEENDLTDESFILDCEDCMFKNNVAAVGGAIQVANKAKGGTLRFNNCYFESNQATGDAGTYHTTSKANAMFNKCTFYKGTGNNNGYEIYSNSATAKVGINNCTFNAITKVSGGNGCAVAIKGPNVIANSTIWSSSGTGKRNLISLGATNNLNEAAIINCFLRNGSSTYGALWIHQNYYTNIKYCLYTGAELNDSVLDTDYTISDSYDLKVGATILGKNGETLASTDNVKITVDGVSHQYYTWYWTDDYKENFTCPTLEQVKTAISGTAEIGPDFLAWLESIDGALTTDIAGRARDINAMCPGSYQQDGTTVPAN